MIATIPAATVVGVEGRPVSVEVDVAMGAPSFAVVGLPDASCREARDRVRAAVKSCKFQAKGKSVNPNERRVTVNLAPSDLRKSGTATDLAIAIGFLVATDVLDPSEVRGLAFIGELGLDGSLRTTRGIVPLVDAIEEETIVVPAECAGQATWLGRHKVRAATTLQQLVAMLKGTEPWMDADLRPLPIRPRREPDLADVKGQPLARWALEVAAAGGHNLMLTGSPGAGKTMLARRIAGLLPNLDAATSLQVTKIHSAAGLISDETGLVTRPPFRAPHHTASVTSLIGGGSGIIHPGEISLAHGGVLFFDEMSEAPRSLLDALRQPLEDGLVHIARTHTKVSLPARFLCVAATNPCPCGEGLNINACRCSDGTRLRYSAKLSGPLRDRFDLRIRVDRPHVDQIFDANAAEGTEVVAQRVFAARERMNGRGALNATLDVRELNLAAPLNRNAEMLLRAEMQSGRLTARGLHRVHRVALTLADLDGSAVLTDLHVASALQLRVEEHIEQ